MSGDRAIRLLDGVCLKEEIDGWPAGTRGVVVQTYPDGVLVEIADGDGDSLDVIEATHAQVRLVYRAPASVRG